MSRRSRRNSMRSHSLQTHRKSYSDERDLREHLERRAQQAVLGENSAQRKLYLTEYDMVKKYHLCSGLLNNSLWEAHEMKAHSEKSMNVSDVKVTDEDGYLSRSKTIKANNKIVKERIWITVKLTIQNRVAKVDVEPNATSWTYSRSLRLHVQMWNAVVNGWTWSRRNLSYSLKVNEFAALTTCEFVSQHNGYKPNIVWRWSEALESSWARWAQWPLVRTMIRDCRRECCVSFILCCTHALSVFGFSPCLVDQLTLTRWVKMSIRSLSAQSSHGKVSHRHIGHRAVVLRALHSTHGSAYRATARAPERLAERYIYSQHGDPKFGAKKFRICIDWHATKAWISKTTIIGSQSMGRSKLNVRECSCVANRRWRTVFIRNIT